MKLHVRGGQKLEGSGTVPPDKSILHRACMLAALGEGRCRVAPLGAGADNRSTLSVLEALGAEVVIDGDAATIVGVGGPKGFRAPEGALDCGNSGTTIRLMSGILAACEGLEVTLDGDASLRRRPMARLRPLEKMGAVLRPASAETGSSIRGAAENEVKDPLRPPFTVVGAKLAGTEHVLPMASAQLKSALLLAGLWAEGPTTVIEPRTSRDHTERMLAGRGAKLSRDVDAEGRHRVRLEPLERRWRLEEAEVAPDFSAATFLLAAAAIGGGEISVRSGTNPTRTGALDALRGMGLDIEERDPSDAAGEPIATLVARPGPKLAGRRIAGEEALRALDELPMLAGLALFAEGETVIADAAELSAKESDRIAEVVKVLRAFGGEVEARADGMVIRGGAPMHPATVDAAHDHRIAMMAAVVAMGISGTSTITGAEVIGVSFPDFVETFGGLGAELTLEP